MPAVTANDLSRAAPLFEGWQETMIWSCLDGSMGRVLADDPAAPASAAAVIADFCFLAGAPSAALLREVEGTPLVIPGSAAWAALIERLWAGRARRFERFATKKEPRAFDRRRLLRFAGALPDGCRLVPIDGPLARRLAGQAWSQDLCGRFPDWPGPQGRGLGFAALCAGEPVAGASSYTVYRGGIEIEVDTAPAHRRKGLARACAARLILECLDRGLYPSWDAHDARSLALAESLGYHSAGPYAAYERVEPVHK